MKYAERHSKIYEDYKAAQDLWPELKSIPLKINGRLARTLGRTARNRFSGKACFIELGKRFLEAAPYT